MVRDFYKCLHCRYIEEAEHTVHVFNEWTYYSNSKHVESCGCGATGTVKTSHVTKASNIINGKSICLECGYMVTLTSGFIPIIQNVQKVTLNGSYVLPEGVIVLVDEDLDAYYNGTLIFYDKNNLPQTQ